MVYVPGFSPALMAEDTGGPLRVALPLGVQPTAPTVMTTTGVQPTAPPIMTQPVVPTASTPYIPATQPRLRGSAYTPRDLQNAGYLDEVEMGPEEGFRRADPSFSRRVSDSNTFYTDPDTGFFYNDDASRVGHYFTTNRGGAATAEGAGGFAEFNPNATYRLVNVADGNSVVYEGVGRDGLIGVQGAAQRFAQEQGDQGDWRVEQMDPTSGQWSTVARDTRPSNIAGLIADIALPVAGAILLPGVGGALGGALGAGLGAAGGSALSSIAQGRSLTDTLLRAGLSGVAAGGLSAVGGAPFIGGASGGASGVGGALGGSLAAAGPAAQAGLNAAGLGVGNIVVTGGLGAGLGATAGGAIGAGLGSAAGGALGNGITVTGTRPTAPSLPVAPVAGGAAVVGGGALAGAGGTPNPNVPETVGNDIVVEGTTPNTTPGEIGGGLLPSGGVLPTTGGGTTNTLEGPSNPEQGGMDLDDIIRYLRAGSLGVGLLGSLFQGGGGQGNNRIPSGFGSGQLNPVFGGSLPAATLPGASDNFAPRQTNQDWYRYGYGPGQSFFNYVPQGQPNTSTAYTGYAEGGLTMGDDTPRDAFAVEGPGTGRSDEIPALLSDGEYVFDAETVALLGDGSTKAGAERLDQFRVKVRKHKGQQLAKGQFSPNAKPPERYMYGGLS